MLRRERSLEFLGRNSFDVRSGVFTLKHPYHPLVFQLYPMVHLAAPEFYNAVAARLRVCDAILYEGVKSATVGILTKAYELAGGSSRLGLVTQSKALRLEEMPGTLIHADVSGADFDCEWRRVPLLHRLLVYSLAPLVGLFFRFAGTKDLIAAGMHVDELSTEEVSDEDESGWDLMEEAIMETRDRHLVGVLRAFFEQRQSEPLTAAVVFGAQHMPAITCALTRGCGYRVVRADTLIVFELVERGDT